MYRCINIIYTIINSKYSEILYTLWFQLLYIIGILMSCVYIGAVLMSYIECLLDIGWQLVILLLFFFYIKSDCIIHSLVKQFFFLNVLSIVKYTRQPAYYYS